jgi:hypothetical protein
MQWVMFTAIGPIRLTANFIMDLVAFLQHCIHTNLKKTKVSTRQDPLSKQTIGMVSKYLAERSERMVPMK